MRQITREERTTLYVGKSKKRKKISLKVNRKKLNKKYFQLFDKDTLEQIVYGGSSSGKSYAIAQLMILWAMQGRSILVARKVARTIKKSIFSELKKIISDFKLRKYFKIRESDIEIHCKCSKGSIMFVGLDDSEKLKSITPVRAKAFDLLVVEEATEISEADYNQLILRMRGRSSFKKKRLLLFNPIFRKHWIYKRFFEGLKEEEHFFYDSPEKFILHTTYKDNEHLGDEEIRSLEDMKEVSPYHYMVYALGLFGVLGKRILPNVKKQPIDFESIKHLPDYIGGDFGFTNDPTGTLFTKYDKERKIIYVYDEIYKKQLTNDLVAEEVNIKIDNWDLDRPRSWWDSQEPKSIKELRNHGLKGAKEASKGADSILKGLDWLMQHTIIVDPRCENFIDETDLYVWKEEGGEPINKPIDKFNHLIDSLRYAYWTFIKSSGKFAASRKRI